MAGQGHSCHVLSQDRRFERLAKRQVCRHRRTEEADLVLDIGGKELQRGQAHQYEEGEKQREQPKERAGDFAKNPADLDRDKEQENIQLRGVFAEENKIDQRKG